MILRNEVQALMEEFPLSEILEALAAESAYWARKEKSEAWKRARKMILKTTAVVVEIGL